MQASNCKAEGCNFEPEKRALESKALKLKTVAPVREPSVAFIVSPFMSEDLNTPLADRDGPPYRSFTPPVMLG